MADNSSLYGTTTPSGTVASSNYTTLYSGGNNFVPTGDNVIITGTLTVNGCAILTDCSAFNFLPFNANTLNIGLESTTLALGSTTGVTTVRNQLATNNYAFPVADGSANQVLVTDGSGNLSFASVGSLGVVTSITGTANQVIASSPTGAVTLSLPQDIATTSNPVFAGITGGNLTVGVVDDQTIASTNTNGDINIIPNGSGVVNLFGDIVKIGDANANASITTNGTGNLSLNTNFFTNSGSITIIQGVNGNIVLDPNGTGYVSVTKDLIGQGAIKATTTLQIDGATSGHTSFNQAATGATIDYYLPTAQGAVSTVLTNDGSGNLSWALPGGGGSTFGNITIAVVDDNTISTTTGDLVLTSATGDVDVSGSLNVDNGALFVNATTNRVGINNNNPEFELHIDQGLDGLTQLAMSTVDRTALWTINDGDDLFSFSYGFPAGSYNRLQFSPTDQWFNTGRLGVGTATPAYELDVQGTGRFTSNLIATGGFTLNGTTSGYSDFAQPAIAANISYTLPAAQGAVSTVLTNDGSGNLSWAATGNPFDQSLNTTDNVEFASVKSSLINANEIRPFDAADVDVRMITTGSGTYQTGKASVYIQEDAGYPDGSAGIVVNSNQWSFRSDGATQFPNYMFPAADGAVNEVLTTDGAGNVFWALPGGGGSTFGNITIAVDTDNTISTTTGDLVVTSATGIIEMGAIVDVTGDYININSDNTYANAAVRFGNSAEIVYTVATDNFEITKPVGNITIAQATDNTISTTTGNLVLASATNVIDATSAAIDANSYTIDGKGTIDSQTTTTTSTATVTLNTTTRAGLKCLISVVDNVTSERHIVEALLLEQGSTAYITTYTEIYSSAALATFSADISAGNLRLQATPASANSTTFTVIRTSID